MDYDQLLTFITITKKLNFSKAAEELSVTQPTVTARIKNLEQELDCKLFERIGHKLILTDDGKTLLDYANKTINLMKQAKSAIHLSKEPFLKIGFAPAFCQSIVLSTINKVKKKFDNVSIHITEGQDSIELLTKVLHEEIDVCFIRNPKNFYKELQFEFLQDDHLVLIYPNDDPLSQLNEVKISDLNGKKMISHRKNAPLWEKIEEQLLEVDYVSTMEISSIEMIKLMVKNGLGINIIPESGVEPHELLEFGALPFKDIGSGLENKIYAVYPKDKFTPGYFNVLIQSFKESLEMNKRKKQELAKT